VLKSAVGVTITLSIVANPLKLSVFNVISNVLLAVPLLVKLNSINFTNSGTASKTFDIT
jgi:hypothetical protein